MPKKPSRTAEKRDPKTAAIVFIVVAIIVGAGIFWATSVHRADAEYVSTYVPDVPKELPVLDAPPGTKALFFGDSWTVGYHALPVTQGYAYQAGRALQWDFAVSGANGTGYLNRGEEGAGTYLDRLKALHVNSSVQLVVLQGGVSDAFLQLNDLSAAATAAIDRLREVFPNAQIVMVGLAPTTLPAKPQFATADHILATAAAFKSVHYVSPLMDEWITAENYPWAIDVGANYAPTTAGHTYLGERLTDALRTLMRN